MPERSYWVKSALATNSSASLSLLKRGSFFFIVIRRYATFALRLALTNRNSTRLFSAFPMRRSIASECPSYSASSSLQMTEVVVPTSFASCYWMMPARLRSS